MFLSYRGEDKEHYFMGKLKRGHTIINPDTKQEQYIPGREQSHEHLLEQDWQFPSMEASVEDAVLKAYDAVAPTKILEDANVKVTKMKLADLIKPEKIVRIHTEQQIKEFRQSVEMFGQSRQIIS